MTISISNAVQESWLVVSVFVLLFFGTLRKKKDPELFSRSITTELKGLAILFVVLSHIGYFLVSDHEFLVPLSNYAGVGVDIFALLSGFGLVVSAFKKDISLKEFYKKRFAKIYVPVLAVSLIFLAADIIFLHLGYSVSMIMQNIFGFFPRADLYQDINSPLWFVTPLLFFYLIFPLIFSKKSPYRSALVIGFAALWFIDRGTVEMTQNIPIYEGVAGLYRLHLLSFPIGMILGILATQPPAWMQRIILFVREKKSTGRLHGTAGTIGSGIIFLLLLVILQINHVSANWRQEVFWSLMLSLCIIMTSILSVYESRFLVFIGSISFEIYLLHWPLLYRYDPFFGHMSAGSATLVSIGVIIALSFGLQILIKRIFSFGSRSTLI